MHNLLMIPTKIVRIVPNINPFAFNEVGNPNNPLPTVPYNNETIIPLYDPYSNLPNVRLNHDLFSYSFFPNKVY